MEGHYAETYVVFPLTIESVVSIEDFVEPLMERSVVTDEAVTRIVESGGRMELSIGCSCERSGGLVLAPDLIARAAGRRLSLAVNVYATTAMSDPSATKSSCGEAPAGKC